MQRERVEINKEIIKSTKTKIEKTLEERQKEKKKY